MSVPMFFDSRAMRRQAFLVMIALGLSEVLIPDAVQEDHENRDRHKEQDHGGGGIHQHANLEIGIDRWTQWQPVRRRCKGMLSKMFHTQSAYENDHAAKEREERRPNRDRVAEHHVLIREQHDQKER